MANKFVVFFFLLILIVPITTILFKVLVPIIAETAESDDLKNENLFSLSSDFLALNGTSVNLNLSHKDAVINSFTPVHKNQVWLDFDGGYNRDDRVKNVKVIQSDLIIFNNDTNFTFSAWIKNNKLGGTNSNKSACIIGVQFRYSLYFYTNLSTDKFRFGIRNMSGALQVSVEAGKVSDKLGEWTHLVGVYNITNVIIYQDGLFIETDVKPAGLIFTNKSILSIGGGEGILNGNGIGWNGSIDEARIYNRSLSATEILEIYNSGRVKNSSLNSTGLVLWQPFEENSGLTTHDVFNSSLDGTITGAIWGNDGVNIPLGNLTDYTLVETNFTLINNDLSWRGITINYENHWYNDFGVHVKILKFAGAFLGLCLLIFIIRQVASMFSGDNYYYDEYY